MRKMWESVKRGKVPWSLKEFLETLKWVLSLHLKPKDDWNHLKREFSIYDEEKGTVDSYQFNSFNSVNQVAFYMQRKYGKKKFAPHLYRFMTIMTFLKKHKTQLIADKLMWMTKDDDCIKDELLMALCALPYSDEHQDEEGNREFKYNYDEVVKRARKLIKERKKDKQ